MIITDIKPQKRRKDRMNIFLDGKFSFSLPLELIVKYKLQADKEISRELVDKLVKENDYKFWFDNCLKFLSFRPRSQKEVIDYLISKDVGDQVRLMVIDRLIDLKFIDDRKFALWFIEQRARFRPKGRRLIEMELRQKGIGKNTIEDAFTGFLQTADSDRNPALSLITKKMPAWERLEPAKIRQKIQGFLLRRGFDWEDVNMVLKHLKDKKAI